MSLPLAQDTVDTSRSSKLVFYSNRLLTTLQSLKRGPGESVIARLEYQTSHLPMFRTPSLGHVDGRSCMSTIDEEDLIAGVTLRG